MLWLTVKEGMVVGIGGYSGWSLVCSIYDPRSYTMLLTFKVILPSLDKPCWKHSHTQHEVCVHGPLNPVRLTRLITTSTFFTNLYPSMVHNTLHHNIKSPGLPPPQSHFPLIKIYISLYLNFFVVSTSPDTIQKYKLYSEIQGHILTVSSHTIEKISHILSI